MFVKARNDGLEFVLEGPVDLPVGSDLGIPVEPSSGSKSPPDAPDEDRPRAQLADWARSSPDDADLPVDPAAQHEHYLYGMPKQPCSWSTPATCWPLSLPWDVLHQQAPRWAALIKEPLVVTEDVLVETVNVLSRLSARRHVASLIGLMRASPRTEWLPASTLWFEAGLRRHAERPDQEWPLADCPSFVTMERRGIGRALTYDHQFEQAGFEALMRRKPGD
jgi:predicted nucleic acid-binding protein